jgi:hypothetical protein
MTYWWVNQSKTYQAERNAGIMWAPQQTEAGRQLGHWTAMTQLQPGDMVMHYARGAIRAVGRVEAPAIAADRPYGLPEIWQSPGWMVPVRYFDLAQPIQRNELPLEWRLAAAPFDRNGAVKQIYLSPVSDDFAAELLDEFGDRWPPAAFTDGGGPPAADWRDARAVLVKLVGQPLTTLRGRPNRILEVGETDVTVATDKSPEGQPVPILWVQQALDQLVRDSEVIISPPVVGYRSAFIGAVLRTLPGVAVGMDPPRVWLEDAQDDTETSAARQRQRQPDDVALTGELLKAITELRRWARDGKTAVHKPLLLLLALERVRRGLPRLVSFVDIEPQLRALITEFSPTPGPSHPEYPFWRLQADDIWDVPEASQLPSRASNSDPPVSVLRTRRVQGGLPIRFDELLRARGDVLDQAVTTTLQHFPAELRPRVLERLGWDDIPTRSARRPRRSEQTARIGVPYQEGPLAASRSWRASYQPDPDKVGRGLEGHELTLRALVGAVQACGLEPLLPRSAGPSYDLAWETETTIFVAEVKSLTLANEERQLRLGLGQVLRYWHALSDRAKPVIAVLAVEEKPADESWLALCDRLGIWLLWPESMPAAIAEAVDEKESQARGRS